MERAERRHCIEDALHRHKRDVRERGEDVGHDSVTEIVDAVWGRLPLEIRRSTTRSEVQASLTMLTLRHGIARTRAQSDAPPPAIDS